MNNSSVELINISNDTFTSRVIEFILEVVDVAAKEREINVELLESVLESIEFVKNAHKRVKNNTFMIKSVKNSHFSEFDEILSTFYTSQWGNSEGEIHDKSNVLSTLEIGLIFLQTFGLEIISYEEKSMLDKFFDTQDQIPLWEKSLQNLSKFMVTANKEKELQRIKETVEERVASYSKTIMPNETHSEVHRNSFKLRVSSREVHTIASDNSLTKEYKPSSKEELAEIMNEFSKREEKFYNIKE